MIALGVPLKLIVLFWPEQIVNGLALIVAVGDATGDIVSDWESGWLHPVPDAGATSMRAKTVLVVTFGITTEAFPDESNVTVWLLPPPTE